MAVLALTCCGVLEAQEANQLNDLLTSTAWCSFHYNKISGYSSTTRYQFFRDGRYSTGARGEGYSSGRGGTFASQHDKSGGGNWQVKGNLLYFTVKGAVQNPVSLDVKRNNRGVPILVADGTEFSPCK